MRGLLRTAVLWSDEWGSDCESSPDRATSRRDPVGIAFRSGGRLMPDRTTTKASPTTLVAGQRLDQPTFHALYEAMPPGTRAELIDGVVSMPSPVGLAHGLAQVPVIMWLGQYAENTPGVQVMDNATTILGWKGEPQPDGLLRIRPECGGRNW